MTGVSMFTSRIARTSRAAKPAAALSRQTHAADRVSAAGNQAMLRQPRLQMRSFALPASAPAADKSIEPVPGAQDQSTAVSVFDLTTSGIRIVVDAAGVFTSATYPDGFKFTQTIETSQPLHRATSPYVDLHPNDDAKPFYWTDAEQGRFPTQFRDAPSRNPPAVGSIFWQGTLCLNGVDESSKTVTAYDCLTYGFTLDTSGTVTQRAPDVGSIANHQTTLASEFPDWSFLPWQPRTAVGPGDFPTPGNPLDLPQNGPGLSPPDLPT